MDEKEFQAEYLRQVSVQLEMNEVTWKKLNGHGIDETTMLQPEFTYIAKSKNEAEKLKDHLEKNHCVNLKIVKEGFIKAKWEVSGQALPTKLSKELIDEWVRWLVIQGIKFNCEFDGWGVLLPD